MGKEEGNRMSNGMDKDSQAGEGEGEGQQGRRRGRTIRKSNGMDKDSQAGEGEGEGQSGRVMAWIRTARQEKEKGKDSQGRGEFCGVGTDQGF
jgi:hypothetical protein